MKKLAIVFIGLFLMTFAFQSVNAQQNVTVESNPAIASANIIQTIAIAKVRDIDFGNFTAANGTVVLSAEENTSRTTTGPVLSGGTPASAKFTVTGSEGESYTVDYPATIDLTNGTDVLTLTLSCNVNGSNGLLSGTLGQGGSGSQDLFVGGSLEIESGDSQGLYQNTNDLTVTVNYN